jgi:hypothetical protein
MSHFKEEIKHLTEHEVALLERAGSIEARVKILEDGLKKTQELLARLVAHLEVKFHEDIDDDGHIGSRIC